MSFITDEMLQRGLDYMSKKSAESYQATPNFTDYSQLAKLNENKLWFNKKQVTDIPYWTPETNLNNYLAAEQSSVEAGIKSFANVPTNVLVAGVPNYLGFWVGMGDALFNDDYTFDNALTRIGKKATDLLGETYTRQTSDGGMDFTDPALWFQGISSIGQSAAEMAIAGAGLAKLAQKGTQYGAKLLTKKIAKEIFEDQAEKAAQKGLTEYAAKMLTNKNVTNTAVSSLLGFTEGAMAAKNVYDESKSTLSNMDNASLYNIALKKYMADNDVNKDKAKEVLYDGNVELWAANEKSQFVDSQANAGARTTFWINGTMSSFLNMPQMSSFLRKTDPVMDMLNVNGTPLKGLEKLKKDLVNKFENRLPEKVKNRLDYAATTKRLDEIAYDNLDDAAKAKIKSGGEIKLGGEKGELIRDGLAEGLEEGLQFSGEQEGKREAQAKSKFNISSWLNSDGEAFMETLETVASDINTKEGYFNMLLGAMGGVGQKALMEYAPYIDKTTGEMTKPFSENAVSQTKYAEDANVKAYETARTRMVDIINKRAKIENELKTLATKKPIEYYTELTGDSDAKVSDEFKHIVGKNGIERERKDLMDNLFINSFVASKEVNPEFADMLRDDIEAIKQLDNTVNDEGFGKQGAVLKEQLDAKQRELDELSKQSANFPPDADKKELNDKIVQTKNAVDELNKQVEFAKGKSDAMIAGFSKSTDDNDYKETADEYLNLMTQHKRQSEILDAQFPEAKYSTTGYKGTLLETNLQRTLAKKKLEKLQQKINTTKPQINNELLNSDFAKDLKKTVLANEKMSEEEKKSFEDSFDIALPVYVQHFDKLVEAKVYHALANNNQQKANTVTETEQKKYYNDKAQSYKEKADKINEEVINQLTAVLPSTDMEFEGLDYEPVSEIGKNSNLKDINSQLKDAQKQLDELLKKESEIPSVASNESNDEVLTKLEKEKTYLTGRIDFLQSSKNLALTNNNEEEINNINNELEKAQNELDELLRKKSDITTSNKNNNDFLNELTQNKSRTTSVIDQLQRGKYLTLASIRDEEIRKKQQYNAITNAMNLLLKNDYQSDIVNTHLNDVFSKVKLDETYTQLSDKQKMLSSKEGREQYLTFFEKITQLSKANKIATAKIENANKEDVSEKVTKEDKTESKPVSDNTQKDTTVANTNNNTDNNNKPKNALQQRLYKAKLGNTIIDSLTEKKSLSDDNYENIKAYYKISDATSLADLISDSAHRKAVIKYLDEKQNSDTVDKKLQTEFKKAIAIDNGIAVTETDNTSSELPVESPTQNNNTSSGLPPKTSVQSGTASQDDTDDSSNNVVNDAEETWKTITVSDEAKIKELETKHPELSGVEGGVTVQINSKGETRTIKPLLNNKMVNSMLFSQINNEPFLKKDSEEFADAIAISTLFVMLINEKGHDIDKIIANIGDYLNGIDADKIPESRRINTVMYLTSRFPAALPNLKTRQVDLANAISNYLFDENYIKRDVEVNPDEQYDDDTTADFEEKSSEIENEGTLSINPFTLAQSTATQETVGNVIMSKKTIFNKNEPVNNANFHLLPEILNEPTEVDIEIKDVAKALENKKYAYLNDFLDENENEKFKQLMSANIQFVGYNFSLRLPITVFSNAQELYPDKVWENDKEIAANEEVKNKLIELIEANDDLKPLVLAFIEAEYIFDIDHILNKAENFNFIPLFKFVETLVLRKNILEKGKATIQKSKNGEGYLHIINEKVTLEKSLGSFAEKKTTIYSGHRYELEDMNNPPAKWFVKVPSAKENFFVPIVLDKRPLSEVAITMNVNGVPKEMNIADVLIAAVGNVIDAIGDDTFTKKQGENLQKLFKQFSFLWYDSSSLTKSNENKTTKQQLALILNGNAKSIYTVNTTKHIDIYPFNDEKKNEKGIRFRINDLDNKSLPSIMEIAISNKGIKGTSYPVTQSSTTVNGKSIINTVYKNTSQHNTKLDKDEVIKLLSKAIKEMPTGISGNPDPKTYEGNEKLALPVRIGDDEITSFDKKQFLLRGFVTNVMGRDLEHEGKTTRVFVNNPTIEILSEGKEIDVRNVQKQVEKKQLDEEKEAYRELAKTTISQTVNDNTAESEYNYLDIVWKAARPDSKLESFDKNNIFKEVKEQKQAEEKERIRKLIKTQEKNNAKIFEEIDIRINDAFQQFVNLKLQNINIDFYDKQFKILKKQGNDGLLKAENLLQELLSKIEEEKQKFVDNLLKKVQEEREKFLQTTPTTEVEQTITEEETISPVVSSNGVDAALEGVAVRFNDLKIPFITENNEELKTPMLPSSPFDITEATEEGKTVYYFENKNVKWYLPQVYHNTMIEGSTPYNYDRGFINTLNEIAQWRQNSENDTIKELAVVDITDPNNLKVVNFYNIEQDDTTQYEILPIREGSKNMYIIKYVEPNYSRVFSQTFDSKEEPIDIQTQTITPIETELSLPVKTAIFEKITQSILAKVLADMSKGGRIDEKSFDLQNRLENWLRFLMEKNDSIGELIKEHYYNERLNIFYTTELQELGKELNNHLDLLGIFSVKPLQEAESNDEQDEEDDVNLPENSTENSSWFDGRIFNIDKITSATLRTKLTLGTLNQKDKDGNDVLSEIGEPKPVNYLRLHAKLQDKLEGYGTTDINEMIDILKKEISSVHDSEIQAVISFFKEYDVSIRNSDMQTTIFRIEGGFINAFKNEFVKIYDAQRLEKTNVIVEYKKGVQIGRAISANRANAYRVVFDEWQQAYLNNENNPYFVKEKGLIVPRKEVMGDITEFFNLLEKLEKQEGYAKKMWDLNYKGITVLSLLNAIGIFNINEQMFLELASSRLVLSRNKFLTKDSLFHPTKGKVQNASFLFQLKDVYNIAKIYEPSQEEGDNFNPFGNRANFWRKTLGSYVAKKQNIATKSYRDSKGKQIQSIGMQNHLSITVGRVFNTESQIENGKLKVTPEKQLVQESIKTKSNSLLVDGDIEVRYANEIGQKGNSAENVTIKAMSPNEMDRYFLGISGSVNNETPTEVSINSLFASENIKIEGYSVWFPTPTHADNATTVPEIKTLLYRYDLFDADGNFQIDDITLTSLLMDSLVPELRRMYNMHQELQNRMTNGTTREKALVEMKNDYGDKLVNGMYVLFTVPHVDLFNSDVHNATLRNILKISQTEEEFVKQYVTTHKESLRNYFIDDFTKQNEKLFEDWNKFKIIKQTGKSFKFTQIPAELMNVLNLQNDEKGIKQVIAYLNVNYFRVAMAYNNLFFGEHVEAMKHKKFVDIENINPKNTVSEEMYRNIIAKTMEEATKRYTSIITPMERGAVGNKTYDVISIVDSISSRMSGEYTRVLREAGLISSDKTIYDGNNDTDALVLASWEWTLDLLEYRGDITFNQKRNLTAKIKKGEKLTSQEYGIFKMLKPVEIGEREISINGQPYNKKYYTKCSILTLLPQYTEGLLIDDLRLAMQNKKVSLAIYTSAAKVSDGSDIKIWKTDDTTKALVGMKSQTELEEEIENTKRLRYWKHLGIQQAIPYDESKGKILTVSQENIFITADIEHNYGINVGEKSFLLNGKKVSVKEIKEAKAQARIRMIQIMRDEMLKNLDVTLDENGNVIHEADFKDKIRKRLEEASKSNKYDPDDILLLQMVNEDFIVPLSLSKSADKFESYLQAIVTNAVNKIKVQGLSFVQVSAAGFKTKQMFSDPELTVSEKQKVVMIEGYDLSNGLQNTTFDDEGNVKSVAQVLVNPIYVDKKTGKRIDLRNLAVNGVIPKSAIPDEVRRVILARIPNQKHSSMLTAEIVGFLPPELGDTMVVPYEITTQMGSDFDIDKVYTYIKPYEILDDEEGNKIVKPIEYIDIDDQSSFEQANAQYFDAHWGILTHSKVAPYMMKPLDMKDMYYEVGKMGNKKEGEYIPSKSNFEVHYYSYYNQRNTFRDGVDGKGVVVGIAANAATTEARLQDTNASSVKISKHNNGEMTITPVALDFTLDGKELSLWRLSGKGVGEYAGEKRITGDNIMMILSAALDNAKERLLGEVNLNGLTAPLAMIFSMLRTVNGEIPNMKLINRFFRQEYVMRFTEEYALNNDSFVSPSDKLNENDLLYQLKKELLSKIEGNSKENITDVAEKVKKYIKDVELSDVTLMSDIWTDYNKKEKDTEYYKRQLKVIRYLEYLIALNKTMRPLTNTLNVAKGIGINLLNTENNIQNYEAHILGDKLSTDPTIYDVKIENGKLSVGAPNSDEKEKSVTLKAEEAKNHHNYLNLKSLQGTLEKPSEWYYEFKNSFLLAKDIFSPLYEYYKPFFTTITDEILKQRDFQSRYGRKFNAKESKQLWNTLKAYLYTNIVKNIVKKQPEVFGFEPNESITEIRKKLFKNGTNDNLSSLMSNAKKSDKQIANNLWVKNIIVNTELNLVKFNNSTSMIITPQDMKNSFVELWKMTKDDPAYKTLVPKIVLYYFLEGNIVSPNSLAKVIPNSVLQELGVMEEYQKLKKQFYDMSENEVQENKEIDAFVTEYFQHNPEHAPRAFIGYPDKEYSSEKYQFNYMVEIKRRDDMGRPDENRDSKEDIVPLEIVEVLSKDKTNSDEQTTSDFLRIDYNGNSYVYKRVYANRFLLLPTKGTKGLGYNEYDSGNIHITHSNTPAYSWANYSFKKTNNVFVNEEGTTIPLSTALAGMWQRAQVKEQTEWSANPIQLLINEEKLSKPTINRSEVELNIAEDVPKTALFNILLENEGRKYLALANNHPRWNILLGELKNDPDAQQKLRAAGQILDAIGVLNKDGVFGYKPFSVRLEKEAPNGDKTIEGSYVNNEIVLYFEQLGGKGQENGRETMSAKEQAEFIYRMTSLIMHELMHHSESGLLNDTGVIKELQKIADKEEKPIVKQALEERIAGIINLREDWNNKYKTIMGFWYDNLTTKFLMEKLGVKESAKTNDYERFVKFVKENQQAWLQNTTTNLKISEAISKEVSSYTNLSDKEKAELFDIAYALSSQSEAKASLFNKNAYRKVLNTPYKYDKKKTYLEMLTDIVTNAVKYFLRLFGYKTTDTVLKEMFGMAFVYNKLQFANTNKIYPETSVEINGVPHFFVLNKSSKNTQIAKLLDEKYAPTGQVQKISYNGKLLDEQVKALSEKGVGVAITKDGYVLGALYNNSQNTIYDKRNLLSLLAGEIPKPKKVDNTLEINEKVDELFNEAVRIYNETEGDNTAKEDAVINWYNPITDAQVLGNKQLLANKLDAFFKNPTQSSSKILVEAEKLIANQLKKICQ